MFGWFSRLFGRVRKVNVNVYGVGGGIELEGASQTAPIREIELIGDLTITEGNEEGIGRVWGFIAHLQVEKPRVHGGTDWKLKEFPAHPRSSEIGKTDSDQVNGFVEGGETDDLTLKLDGNGWNMGLTINQSKFEGSYKQWKGGDCAGKVRGGATLTRSA